MKINFEFGKVVPFDALPVNSIALDGYVQGPSLDPKEKKFSFDHHAGVIRLVTKSTCEQVREALCLGLPVDQETTVYCNDIDADTVLAVWLLQHPEKCWDKEVIELVNRIGLVDAHGPIMPVHPLHQHLNPPPAWMRGKPGFEEQSLEMLLEKIELVTKFLSGEFVPPPARLEKPARGFGWSSRTGWKPYEGQGFTDFYKSGFAMGFLYEEAAEGTHLYTVAKASDLVSCHVGPGSAVRPVTSVTQFSETVLGALGRAEQEKNPAQPLANTWGGGSSIGGGPRNPGGVGSCLTPAEVLEVFKTFTEVAL